MGATVGMLVWLAIAGLLACAIGATVYFCARRVDAYAPADCWPADGIDTSAELARADLETMRDRVDQLLNLPPEYVRRFDPQPNQRVKLFELDAFRSDLQEVDEFIPFAQPRRSGYLGSPGGSRARNDGRPQA